MNLLFLLLRRSRGAVALAVCCGLLTGASSAGLIALINRVLSSDGARVDSSTVIGFAGLGALMLAARVCSQLVLARLQTRITFELRHQLSRRILATPLRRLEELGTPRLMATLVNDVHGITQGLMCIPPLLINSGIILGCMTYLAVMSPVVFLALVVFMSLGVGSYWVPMQWVMRLLTQSRTLDDRFFGDLRSLTGGVKELLLHRERRSAFLEQELLPTADKLRQTQVRVATIHGMTASWSLSLFFFFIGLLLFAIPAFAPVTSATLMGYTLAVLYLQQPLEAALTLLPILGTGTVALANIQKLALVEVPAENAPRLPADSGKAVLQQQIELAGVTHAYRREGEDSPFTLGPIHLTLRPGELLFIVGGNGSGKTTLAKLITGLYSPESGEIRVDGRPVRNEDREHYRQYFSTVFADFHLFDALLGLAPATQADRIRGYLSRLQLDRKVSVDAAGMLSTTELSTGQRKRLALLTAYLEDRPVYLFDEWAADQDPTFKEVFYRELLPDLRAAGKAVVVISHDNRYFDVADRLIRLESGAIVAEETASDGQRIAAS